MKERTPSQRGKYVRARGHNFEREISIALRAIFPEARRKLENHRSDALEGVDILHTGRYKIQCKRGRKWCSIAKIEEVNCDEMLGDVPVLVTQGDRKSVMAVLPFDELLRLVQLAEGVAKTSVAWRVLSRG